MNQNDIQTSLISNSEIMENTKNDLAQDTLESNTVKKQNGEEIKDDLPKRALRLEDGTIIYNLKITYKNLFDFQSSYSGSKDLMEAIVKKQTFDHETMVQLIYVGYLGTNPNKKMEYYEFIDHIDFNPKRDMFLFNDLVGMNTSTKN